MKRAKEMLQDPTLRIKETATAVGYADLSDFTRYFKSNVWRSRCLSHEVLPGSRSD